MVRAVQLPAGIEIHRETNGSGRPSAPAVPVIDYSNELEGEPGVVQARRAVPYEAPWCVRGRHSDSRMIGLRQKPRAPPDREGKSGVCCSGDELTGGHRCLLEEPAGGDLLPD